MIRACTFTRKCKISGLIDSLNFKLSYPNPDRNNAKGTMLKVKTIFLTTTPESLAFISKDMMPESASTLSPQSPTALPPIEKLILEECVPGQELSALVIGLRDSPHLLCIDCETFSERDIPLNENEWDTHVSFAPLLLSLSPGGDHLLVATDRNMHIILSLKTLKRVRTLVGHASGPYGKPSACWDGTGTVRGYIPILSCYHLPLLLFLQYYPSSLPPYT